MATFQPRTDDLGVPNSTGVSQGTGPNRTFEQLFSGLTNTAKNVVQIKDTQTQLDIQDQAQKVFDETNNEFGLTPPDAGPSGLTSELDRVQALQAAVEQGKISQVNYYGRLATLSKQLRTKYPGYENIVDQTIQSVTGTRPANAYRDAIFQELGNLSEQASSEEKFRRQYDKENADVLSLIYGDDYFQNPNGYDFKKVQADVGKLKGQSFAVQSEKANLELMKSQGEVNDIQANKVVSQDLSLVVQSTLNKALGQNGPTAQQKIDEFIAKGGGSATELQDFITNVTAAEGQLRANLSQRVQSEYVAKGLLSQDDGNKAVENALYPITKAKEAVLGGDFKLAAKYSTINKAMADQQMTEMLKDPTVLAGVGLDALNKSLGDQYFTQKNDAVTTVAQEVAGRITLGQPGVMKSAIESGNQKVSREVLTQSFKVLTDPNAKGDVVSNTVEQLFGNDAPDFMSPKVVSKDDLEPLFLQFLRPEVTQAIVQKGTPEDLKKYTNWALEKVAAIPAFRAAAGDVNTVAQLDNLNVKYDEKTGRVQFFQSGNLSLQDNKFYGRTLDAFNKVMTVMTPIMEANGVKGQDIAKEVLKSLGVREGGGDQPSVFKKIWDALPSDLTKPINKSSINSSETDRALGKALKEVGPDMDAVMGGIGQVGSDLIEPISAPDAGEIDFSEEEDYDQSLAEDEDAPTPPARPKGMEALAPNGLKTSNIRGYNPDVGNLRPDLVTKLTELQTAFGSDLPIVSGFRDSKRNAKAGGAKHSQHMGGKAVDIDVRNLSIGKRKALIQQARSMGFGGVGVYPNSLHLDVGPTRSWGPNYHNTSLPKWAREVL